MTANVTSVRLSIIQAIETYFRTLVTDALPIGDPFGFNFSTVEIGPLTKNDQKKQYSLGIVAGKEAEKFQMPYVMCFMEVNIEFRATVNRGDPDPGVLIEQLLTVVKRAMTTDRTWGGRAIDTKIIGSEVDLITYADRAAMGVCIAQIQYRYNYADPRATATPPF